MSLRQFLNCAYALLVSEFQRHGADLLEAVRHADELLGRAPGEHEQAAAEVSERSQNEQGLQQLELAMAGIRRRK